MSAHHTHLSQPVDEAWIADWAAEGISALEQYLARHAAFAEYLRRHRGVGSSDGDGAGTR